MKKFIFDPDSYREAPIYGVVVDAIKDAKKYFSTSMARELGRDETEYVSELLETRLERELGVFVSSVIIQKCQTIEDIVEYIRLIRKVHGAGFYFDKTKMRK